MAGAYTAVPPATPNPPDVPPGWGGPDIPGSGGPGGTSEDGQLGGTGNWPFPPVSAGGSGTSGGPFPPGYEPEYSLTITAPTTIPLDDAFAAVSSSLYDQSYYTTGDPALSEIQWTATVDGSTRQLKTLGDPTYENAISSEYVFNEADAGFWGSAFSLDVSLTAADNRKILALQVETTVNGSIITKTITIVIGRVRAYFTTTQTLVRDAPSHPDYSGGDTWGWYDNSSFYKWFRGYEGSHAPGESTPSQYKWASNSWNPNSGGSYVAGSQPEGVTVVSTNETSSVDVSNVSLNRTLDLVLFMSTSRCDVTWVIDILITDGINTIASAGKTVNVNSWEDRQLFKRYWWAWVRIDSITGAISFLNIDKGST